MASQKPHVAIFPAVGMGHLIPLAEFAKRLAVHHGFSITFITTKWRTTPRQTAYTQKLASSGLDIRFVELPEVQMEDVEGLSFEILIFKLMENSKGAVENALKSMLESASPICAFITDLFCTAMIDVGTKLHIPTYVFFTTAAAVLCVMLYHPTLDVETRVCLKQVDHPVNIPGLPPIPPRYLPGPMQDRADPAYQPFLRHCSRLRKASGIFINTSEELERRSIEALVHGKVVNGDGMPSIYTVGPLLAEEEDKEEERADCLKWLDDQSPSSVIFVSFGSEAFLSADQIVELALGLEASGQRFLWVLRSDDGRGVSTLLPPGFESRTKDLGLVLSSWAPQIPVLSHPSTGGFLSHCGWNSTLESIWCGVPMIAWPIQAEQWTNSFVLVNEIKVAIGVTMENDGFVRREQVERAARGLMEGEEGKRMRMRTDELKNSAKIALEEGGNSCNALAAAAALWKENAITSVVSPPPPPLV
eukprot:Gb_10317 [translate_table: standard]